MNGFSKNNIRHQILILLQQAGPLSRADLARRTGLARSTITAAVSSLLDERIVAESQRRKIDGRGRPSVAVSLAPGGRAAIGVDFGFRHVRGVAVDLAHNLMAFEELELGSDYTIQVGMNAAMKVVAQLKRKSGISDQNLIGIGVGLPSPTSHEGVTTRSAMIPKWSGTNVKRLFEERISCPIVVENESRLAARAEHVWGAAKGTQNFAYLKLHSGVGGAILANGIFISGQNGGAGELGHVSLDPIGPICRCGNRGCLEVYAGIPAVLAQIQSVHSDVTLQGLLALYRENDPAASRVLSDTAKRVAQVASMQCNALNPELVLIGGALAEAGKPFVTRIKSEMEPLVLELNRGPRVEIGTLGRNASAMGGVARVFELFAANRL